MSKPTKNTKWRQAAYEQAEETETVRQQFVRDVAKNVDGINADSEKFADGYHTFSPKILPPNKED